MSPPIPVITIDAPLISIQVAALALDSNESEVRRLLEEGSLRGFNIATRNAGKSFVRVTTQSVVDFKSGKVAARPAMSLREILSSHTAQQAKEQLDNILKAIFPLAADPISEFHLAKRFATDPGHIANLTREGSLKLVMGQRRCPGRGNSPLLEMASVVSFLKDRQL